MMKNSKLSKLLVAGVSVAMLASALAPMAFADETSLTTEETNPVSFVVKFVNSDGMTAFNGETPVLNGWKVTDVDNYTVKFPIDTVNQTSGATIDFANEFSLNNRTKEIDSWYGWESGADWSSVDKWSPLGKSGKVNAWTLYENHYDKSAKVVRLLCVVKNKPTISVNLKCDNSDVKGFTNNDIAIDGTKYGKVEADPDTDYFKNEFPTINGQNATESLLKDDVVTLPTYIVKKDYSIEKVVVTPYVNDTKLPNAIETVNGGKVSMKDLFGSYLSANPTATGLKIEVSVKLSETKQVKLTIDDQAEIMKDGKIIEDNQTAVGVTASDIAKLDKYNGVAVSAKVELPTVAIYKTDAAGNTVVNDLYAFSHWVVACDTDVLVDGITPANGYAITNGVFDPSVFKASAVADNTDLDLYPVFVKGENVITYSKAGTPNDKVIKYVNGVPENDKVVYGDAIDFKSGAFENQITGVTSYYKPKTKEGWVVDTTVNGLVDGVVYDKGVQDTEAYGLAKVSDADPFFYLVSDGVYLADYQGLWCDEDGTWYYLIDGCCQTAANGVYEHTNGWFYNFVDGKMVETNGFQMHGTDFYWFVKGECKPEGGADCVEWDGDLYYIEGGKFVPTFNDTFKGSVFVNGVCDK